MRDALAEARRRLGEDATVLHTKQCSAPAWFGLRRTRGVEILAAVDTETGLRASSSLAAPERIMTLEPSLEKMTQQIEDIRCVLTRLDSRAEPPSQRLPSPVFERLVRNGVSENLAQVVAPDDAREQDSARILDILSRRIKCSGPINCKNGQARMALVGPTGVGKTTTAAKLAAHHLLALGKSVALITLDTYRVGAVEQLATYARILSIPLEVALCPEDVDALVRRHSDKDLIVIDTVGRSQRNKAHLAELARFVRAARPTEVHLVVSASSSPAAQKEAVEAFGSLSPTRMILTKLDECPQSGCILDLAACSLLPFSYITYGQEVPDDMEAADQERLARLVWEGVP